jgi:anti-anti-sigma factor
MRTAVVKQLPEKMTARQARALCREIEASMTMSRPHVVLDCSRTRQLDRIAIHLMLCCLEEAMKRNGDVSLAAVPRGAEQLLEATGVTRLFSIFETTEQAVSGFHRMAFARISQPFSLGTPGGAAVASASEFAA